MGRITSGAKTVGKNVYFYSFLYCIGIIGIAVITIGRYDIIIEKLAIVNWGEVILLLGMLYSLPVLALSFVSKFNRTLAIMLAGIVSIIVFVIYWVSATSASDLIVTIHVNSCARGIFCYFSLYRSSKCVQVKIKIR